MSLTCCPACSAVQSQLKKQDKSIGLIMCLNNTGGGGCKLKQRRWIELNDL